MESGHRSERLLCSGILGRVRRGAIVAAYSLLAVLFFTVRYRVSPAAGVLLKALPLSLLLAAVSWKRPYDRFIALGIACSLAGDVLLETRLRVLGILAFMAANSLYIFAFVKKSRKPALIFCAGSYSYAAAGIILLAPYLGDSLFPIIAYALVVTTMLWRAWAQSGLGKEERQAFIGALLFVLSDSILAYKMFVGKFPLASILLMSAYWTGQFLIFLSAAPRKPVPEELKANADDAHEERWEA